MLFKQNETVQFFGDTDKYKIIRSYTGTDGINKYDLISMNGKIEIIAISEDCLVRVH